MKQRRFFILMAVIVMLTAVMTACSSEEDDVNDNEGICLSFRLLNEKGEETTTFNKGENIFFDLEIANNCDTTMVYTLEEWNERVVQYGVSKNGADLFLPSSNDNIIFCVYDKDGKMIGVPYSGIFCYFSLQTWMTIDSHSTYHLRCKWQETGKYDDVTYPLCGCSDLPDLPLGEYQVSFSIEYRKKANDPKSKFRTDVINYKFTVK